MCRSEARSERCGGSHGGHTVLIRGLHSPGRSTEEKEGPRHVRAQGSDSGQMPAGASHLPRPRPQQSAQGWSSRHTLFCRQEASGAPAPGPSSSPGDSALRGREAGAQRPAHRLRGSRRSAATPGKRSPCRNAEPGTGEELSCPPGRTPPPQDPVLRGVSLPQNSLPTGTVPSLH